MASKLISLLDYRITFFFLRATNFRFLIAHVLCQPNPLSRSPIRVACNNVKLSISENYALTRFDVKLEHGQTLQLSGLVILIMKPTRCTNISNLFLE